MRYMIVSQGTYINLCVETTLGWMIVMQFKTMSEFAEFSDQCLGVIGDWMGLAQDIMAERPKTGTNVTKLGTKIVEFINSL